MTDVKANPIEWGDPLLYFHGYKRPSKCGRFMLYCLVEHLYVVRFLAPDRKDEEMYGGDRLVIIDEQGKVHDHFVSPEQAAQVCEVHARKMN